MQQNRGRGGGRQGQQQQRQQQEVENLQRTLRKNMQEWQARTDNRTERTTRVAQLQKKGFRPNEDTVRALITRLQTGTIVESSEQAQKARAMVILFQHQNPRVSLTKSAEEWTALGIDPEELLKRQDFVSNPDLDPSDADLSELSDLSDSEN